MMINRRQGDEAVRLLKFVAIFATGGTERQFVNLALSLEGSRFRVHFGCLRRWGQLLEEIDGRGIPIFDYQVNSDCAHVRLLRERVRHPGCPAGWRPYCRVHPRFGCVSVAEAAAHAADCVPVR